jgi:ABC-type uncharacterized transport system permease subunit
MKTTQRLNGERAAQIIATGFLFCVVAIVYLCSATYWDDYKDEFLVYNYTWNFPLLDFLIWIATPLLLVGLGYLFCQRVFKRR